jgi:MYXO-CTERM domain-containing protein
MRRALFSSITLLALSATPALAEDLYADRTVSGCADYEPAARACGGGSARAFASPSEAVAAASAGDRVLVRAGTYEEQLVVQASGAAGMPIVIRAYESETVEIANVGEPAVFVQGASYVTIEGLSVHDVLGFGRIEDSDHIVIRRVTFERATATGTTGGLKLVRATRCSIEESAFLDANDNVVLQESDENRFVSNRFETGRHSLLSVRCSNRNVFRGNRFSNADQKAMEIYDCEGVSDAPIRYDATHRNVIEDNRFELTRSSTRSHDYNAIQYAGQEGIVRRNFFYDNAGGGLHFQVYPDEALVNYAHRAYHNTFVDNACYALGASEDDGADYHGTVVRFNVLYGNTGCAGEPEQTLIRNTGAVMLSDNVLADSDPGFVDLAGRDLALLESSALVDAAGFLTTAVDAGSGTTLRVADALYFTDGHGIEGESGDAIQLEGGTEAARIVSIDLATNTLELATPLRWTAGQGVALAFAGEAPDAGAVELGGMPVVPVLDGGVPGADAGAVVPGTDGGVVPGRDGGARASTEDDGCGCSTSEPAPIGTGLAVVLAVRLARRRQRMSIP